MICFTLRKRRCEAGNYVAVQKHGCLDPGPPQSSVVGRHQGGNTSLLEVLGVLLVVCFVYYLIHRYAPNNTIKQITLAVIVIGTVMWLLDLYFDIRGTLTRIRIGR